MRPTSCATPTGRPSCSGFASPRIKVSLSAAIGIEVALAAGNPRLGRDAFLGNFVVYLLDYLVVALTGDHVFHNIGAKPGMLVIFNAVGWGSLAASIWLAIRTKSLGTYWKPVLIMAGLWVLGVSFYLYMAVSGMTNPPMEWGYPRTVEGFLPRHQPRPV